MRAYQVFADMTPEQASALLSAFKERSPATYRQSLALASAALKARPVYLMRQPIEKQAQAARRALARVAANDAAEEVLATYFLDCQRELLVEWLETAGVEHEEGTLKEARPPAPEPAKLRDAVDAFRKASDDWNRDLLLRAFAAQSSIDWPALDDLLEAGERTQDS
jgi:hypothetical protein